MFLINEAEIVLPEIILLIPVPHERSRGSPVLNTSCTTCFSHGAEIVLSEIILFIPVPRERSRGSPA